MGLIQLQAPACEPISLAQAKIYLRIDHAEEDDLIKHLVRTARQAVESYTVRTLIRQSWRFTFNAGFGSALSDHDFLSGAKTYGVQGVEIPRSPFMEMIDSPKLIDAYGIHEIKQYRTDTSGRVAYLHLTPSLMNSLSGRGMIQVDFWAGYGISPEDVPDPLRQAILMIVAQLYANQSSANDNGLFVPPLNEGIIQLIKPYRSFRLN